MLAQLRNRLTYANVVSTLCLFILFGGSAYAAVTITGKNVKNSSLTGSDIKNSSLSTSDVKNGSLLARDFKLGQLPAGPQGATGAQGPKGDRGLAGSDAQFNGAAAGGDLVGTYPNPSIAPDAVGGAEVADGSLGGGDVNESSLGQVPSAASANSSNTADRADAADVAGPLAYARVNDDGTQSTTASMNATVTKYVSAGTPATGVYCITTPYAQSQVDAVSVTLRQGNIFTLDDHVAQAIVAIASGGCPTGQDVIVTTWDISANARVDHGFHIVIQGTPP